MDPICSAYNIICEPVLMLKPETALILNKIPDKQPFILTTTGFIHVGGFFHNAIE